MASQKGSTTANSGLFGQPIEGQLTFDQLSGPKLFTPIPLSSPVSGTNENIITHDNVSPFNQIQQTPQQTPKKLSSIHAATDRSFNISPFTQHQTSQHSQNMSNPHQSFYDVTSQEAPNLCQPQTQSIYGMPPYSPAQSTPYVPAQSTPYSPAQSIPYAPAQSVSYIPVQSRSYAPTHTTPYVPSQAPYLPESLPQALPAPEYVPPTPGLHADGPLPSNQQYRPTQVVSPQPKSVSQNFPQMTSSSQYNQAESTEQQQQQQTIPPTDTAPKPMYNVLPSSGNEHTPTIAATPVIPHWFYLKDSSQWIPFSYVDSKNLEASYLNRSAKMLVCTDGGRCDVDLNKMQRTSAYWCEAPCPVKRCTWYVKGDVEGKFIPYDVNIAEKLEEEYLSMLSKGIYNIRVDIGPGTFVIFHNPNILVQYVSLVEKGLDWTGEDSKIRPKIVRRGITEIQEEIGPGELATVDHLCFVVHGIGPVADLRMRSIIECVDDFRKNSLNLTASHGFTYNGKAANRVEYLPIQWHSCLRTDRHGIDSQLTALSLPSISKLRNFTNDTLTDILFFTSPTYCQTICDTVVNEMNKMYQLFKSRNPLYKGNVSVVGHSLGTCILFDILANQIDATVNVNKPEMYEDAGEDIENITQQQLPLKQTSLSLNASSTAQVGHTSELPSITELLSKLSLSNLEKMFNEEQIDTDTLMMCSEPDLRDLGIPFGPRKKLSAFIKEQSNPTESLTAPPSASSSSALVSTSCSTRGTQTPVPTNEAAESIQFAYKVGHAGTGQPLVKYAKLEFETDALFCFGSPIGLFLTCRGVSSIGIDFKLPKCQKFLNIFHPYDPVVYRLEPLINKEVDIPPVLIPHHKGRKRFHLEIKENLSRVGANLKSGILDAVNRTWSSINDFARAHRSDGSEQQQIEADSSSSSSDVTQESIEDSIITSKEKLLNFGALNNGDRVDYVLQEKPFEILNEYIFAISSHSCYWTSEDTALLLLKQIYKQ